MGRVDVQELTRDEATARRAELIEHLGMSLSNARRMVDAGIADSETFASVREVETLDWLLSDD